MGNLWGDQRLKTRRPDDSRNGCDVPPLGSVEWGPWQRAVPAAELEQQCLATKRIQRAWRCYRLDTRLPARAMQEKEHGGHVSSDNPLVFLASGGEEFYRLPRFEVDSSDLINE